MGVVKTPEKKPLVKTPEKEGVEHAEPWKPPSARNRDQRQDGTWTSYSRDLNATTPEGPSFRLALASRRRQEALVEEAHALALRKMQSEHQETVAKTLIKAAEERAKLTDDYNQKLKASVMNEAKEKKFLVDDHVQRELQLVSKQAAREAEVARERTSREAEIIARHAQLVERSNKEAAEMHETLRKAVDDALRCRDEAARQRDVVERERDDLRRERNSMQREKEDAVIERDLAKIACDEARQDRSRAVKNRDDALRLQQQSDRECDSLRARVAAADAAFGCVSNQVLGLSNEATTLKSQMKERCLKRLAAALDQRACNDRRGLLQSKLTAWHKETQRHQNDMNKARSFRRILGALMNRQTRLGFSTWSLFARQRSKVRRIFLGCFVAKKKRIAWRTWIRSVKDHRRKHQILQKTILTLTRIQRSKALRTWLAMTKAQSRRDQVLLTYLRRALHRDKARGFQSWKKTSLEIQRRRLKTRKIIQRCLFTKAQQRTAAAWRTWSLVVFHVLKRQDDVLSRSLARWRRRRLASALRHWTARAQRDAHIERTVRRVLRRLGENKDKRLIRRGFRCWTQQTSALRRQTVILDRILRRLMKSHLWRGLKKWIAFNVHRQRSEHLVRKILTAMSRRLEARALLTWHRYNSLLTAAHNDNLLHQQLLLLDDNDDDDSVDDDPPPVAEELHPSGCIGRLCRWPRRRRRRTSSSKKKNHPDNTPEPLRESSEEDQYR